MQTYTQDFFGPHSPAVVDSTVNTDAAKRLLLNSDEQPLSHEQVRRIIRLLDRQQRRIDGLCAALVSYGETQESLTQKTRHLSYFNRQS